MKLSDTRFLGDHFGHAVEISDYPVTLLGGLLISYRAGVWCDECRIWLIEQDEHHIVVDPVIEEDS